MQRGWPGRTVPATRSEREMGEGQPHDLLARVSSPDASSQFTRADSRKPPNQPQHSRMDVGVCEAAVGRGSVRAITCLPGEQEIGCWH